MASISQSLSPFELPPSPFSPDSIFYKPQIFVLDPLIVRTQTNFLFFVGYLEGVDPSKQKHIECLHLSTRGYGGLSLFPDTHLKESDDQTGAIFFEHLLSGDNIVIVNTRYII